MTHFPSIGRASWMTGLAIGFALAATSGPAMASSRTRLVHCGDQTCLRISGHRSSSTVAIRIAGQPLAVEGGRTWRATVPLSMARSAANASRDRLTLTMINPETQAQTVAFVALPPGALGRRVELATLTVNAR